MIIHINGHPGIGKLTIGLKLAELLGAKLLDNHSVYNVALALEEFKSERYYQTLRNVREIAYRCIERLPSREIVILTNAHAEGSAWGEESWHRIERLAQYRSCVLVSIVLECSVEENRVRIAQEARLLKRKLVSEEIPLERRTLMDKAGDAHLRLDVSNLDALNAAERIFAFLKMRDLRARYWND